MRKYWGWEIRAIPWIHVDFLLSEHTKLSPWSGITRWPDLYVEGDRLACQGLDLDTPKLLRFYTIRTGSESLRLDWRPDGIVHCFWMPIVSLSCGRISAWRCRCPASVVIQRCLQNAWAEFDREHENTKTQMLPIIEFHPVPVPLFILWDLIENPTVFRPNIIPTLRCYPVLHPKVDRNA